VSKTSIGHDLKGSRRRKRHEFAFSVDFFAGLAAGLAVAVAVYLWQQQAITAVRSDTIGRAATPRPAQSAIEPATPDEVVPVFDFPTILPTREVVITEHDGSADSSTTPSAPILRPGAYVLHFGVFKDESRAERLRAELMRLGMPSQLQRIVIDKVVHYRVRMGPISDLAELNRTRATLHRSDITAESIRVGE